MALRWQAECYNGSNNQWNEYFATTQFDIYDGVWREKNNPETSLRVDNGRLLVISHSEVVVSISLVNIIVTIPDLPVTEIAPVEEFLAKLDTAAAFVMKSDEEEIKFDGTTMYASFFVNGKMEETYVVIDGDNLVGYYNQDGIWLKLIEPIPDDQKGTLTVEIIFGTYYPAPLDPELYDKADGVWTLKENNSIVLRMKDGELVTTVDGVIATANLDTFTITLPDEVKNAVVKPV